MKKFILTTITALAATFVSAESIMQPVNDMGYGTFSGRLQTLSMYRDFEGVGNGFNTTLGFVLEYTTPELAGFDGGLAYNYAFELHENNNTDLLANDDINILNEGWVRYNFGAMNLTNTALLVGRKINHGEVFRTDDYRQKARSIETVQIQSKDLENATITIGHAVKLSNWIDAGDNWKFNDFGEVFGMGYDTDGVTWGETVCNRIYGVELAFFDAYAWDIANLAGVRAKLEMAENSSVNVYYRHENDVGRAVDRSSDAYGISVQQKVGGATIEPGYFGVSGDALLFQETTTGINHPLGATMMIYASQFNGGADTVYLKATTKNGQTTLYGLYNYTWHDHTKTAYDGQEVNVVVKQAITDDFFVCIKGGVGHRNMADTISDNTTATDARMFVTYTF